MLDRLPLIGALTAAWLTAVALVPRAGAQAPPKKSPLAVLLVTHDPAAPPRAFGDTSDARGPSLYRERGAAFAALLGEHFERVRVVYGPAYDVSMSDEVDVTLFDAVPAALEGSATIKDPETGIETYRPTRFLPRSFDRPALMVAESSARIGEGIGLKLDWL